MKIRSTDLSREWCKPRKIMDHQFFYVLQNIQSGLTDSLLAKRWFWNWFVDSLGDFRFGFAFNALQFRFLHNSPCASWSLASSTITKSSNCQGSGLVGNHRQLLSCLCLAGTSNPPLCQLIMSQPAPLITDIIGMMGRPLATIDKAKLSASRWIWIPDTHLQDPNPPTLISSHLYTFWETWLLWKKKKNQILVCLTSLTMGRAYMHTDIIDISRNVCSLPLSPPYSFDFRPHLLSHWAAMIWFPQFSVNQIYFGVAELLPLKGVHSLVQWV